MSIFSSEEYLKECNRLQSAMNGVFGKFKTCFLNTQPPVPEPNWLASVLLRHESQLTEFGMKMTQVSMAVDFLLTKLGEEDMKEFHAQWTKTVDRVIVGLDKIKEETKKPKILT